MYLNSVNAWNGLENLAHKYKETFHLRKSLMDEGVRRLSSLCISAPYLCVDTTKQAWDSEVLNALCATAEQMNLSERRADFLMGEAVNVTENRPAVHALWRKQAVRGSAALPDGLNAMLQLAEQLRARADIDDVVHIGIGGSSLDPEMALQALKPFTRPLSAFMW